MPPETPIEGAQTAETVRCSAAWEPGGGEPDRGSHRCSLQAGHATLHRCGACGEVWDDKARWFEQNVLRADEPCMCGTEFTCMANHNGSES